MKTEEISIQPGCKKVEIDFENNRVIVFYEEKHDFKRGDYLFDDGFIYILDFIDAKNRMIYISMYESSFKTRIGDGRSFINKKNNRVRFATPEEISLLDQKLLESGYKFNKETLELGKVDVFQDKDIVLVKDERSSIWQLRAFKKMCGSIFICYGADKKGKPWTNCIKYYGNEHLLGTTNKPE